ncbi:hypothetical protein R3P38DRAFT_2773817 [Favolaschia claudopus]|uniref:Uncharacterized protein n=1 Tax=Favolaschia claudopus TaxID=2862362 RepID=A0AAW0C5P6_9AGAR
MPFPLPRVLLVFFSCFGAGSLWIAGCSVAIRDRDRKVIQWAVYALCCITAFIEGAKAVVTANALDHVPQLVGPSSSPDIRSRTRQLISIRGLEHCLDLVSTITGPGNNCQFWIFSKDGELPPFQIHITVAREVSTVF